MSDSCELSMLLPVQYTVRQAKLYVDALLWRGAAGTNAARVLPRIHGGELGDAVATRGPPLELVFEFLSAEAARGARDATIRNFFSALREFYRYVDDQDGDVDLVNIRAWYKEWVEHQYQRVRARKLNERVAYHQGKTVASLFARAMEVPFVSMATGTRLKKPRKSKRTLGLEADKASLATTRAFGGDLLDIVSCLSFDNCMGPLPVTVTLQSNGSSKELWCGLQPASRVRAEVHAEALKVGGPKMIRAFRSRRSLHPELTERFKVINLRTSAEFLIFIAQTGMNNAQALAMTMGDFRYESILDGYALRKYKHRKRGEVEFEIYGEYRPHFERYLKFRKQAFPPGYSTLLFPVLSRPGIPLGRQLDITNVRRLLVELGRPFVSPQKLRGTRVNWLARAVGDNSLVADMAQHDVTTLERIYLKPNHQVAAVEWTEYFGSVDRSVQLAAGPGS
ncbi:hypothetical protein LY625_07265, partial [Lysobacter sp. GX 14042]|uniref:hypothetical protein n=1 Tax=Lysobacter sp. GX 14042 TaxID=2907155 RepID=UPI001F2A4267